MSRRTAPEITIWSAASPHVTATEREQAAAALLAGDGGSARPRGMLLVTCHRVERYWIAEDGAATAESGVTLPATARALGGEPAVRHLIRLAVGLESSVVGEDQILHQLRGAYADARRRGALPESLDRLFQFALRTGRRSRSWRDGSPRSLADVALSVISDRAGSLAGRPVLVVGAGRMGRLAAFAAHRAAARVTVASRDRTRAEQVAGSVDGSAVTIDEVDAATGAAGVIVALGGPWYPAPAVATSIGAMSVTVVDLSQPAAVGGAFREALGDRLVTVDGLAGLPQDPIDARLTARLEAAAEEATREYLAWHERRAAADAARELTERAEDERARALERLWRDLPHLSAMDRARIDAMSRALAEGLLREPLERLGLDADGSHERAARELFGL